MYNGIIIGALTFAFICGYIIVSFVIGLWFKSKINQDKKYKNNTSSDDTKAEGNDEGYWTGHSKWQEEKHRDNSSNNKVPVKDEIYYAQVLGLQGDIAFVVVRNRYKDLVLQYHPDKVNHLGPKIQEFAEHEMKEINEAFQFFKNRYA